MGDKSQKDKHKGQKQKAEKDAAKNQERKDKQDGSTSTPTVPGKARP